MSRLASAGPAATRGQCNQPFVIAPAGTSRCRRMNATTGLIVSRACDSDGGVESGRRSVRSTGDDSIAQNLFKRLPGVPLEQAYVSDVITIEWFGNRCHPDSTQSLYRRVTNRCDLNSSGTVESDVTDTQLYILVVVRLGPVRRESPPSTRSNRARPASLSSLHPEQSSDAARHVVPVQQCADSRHPSPSSGRTAVGS